MEKSRSDALEELMRKHPLLARAVKNHPLGDLRYDFPGDEIRRVQASMAAGATHFSDKELFALQEVTYLTVTFYHYLQRVDVDLADFNDLLYVDQSTFSGLDSFCSLCSAYRTTQGEVRSSLPQRVDSRATLKEQFTAMYREFVAEANFEKKCRLLLDLFKLQIIFAGLTYD